MVTLTGMFNNFKPFKALLVGDLMLDTYTIGDVRRVSPEAPVTVLNVEREEQRPGGAGNVALNIMDFGGSVSCVGRVGNDATADVLKNLLDSEGADVKNIVTQDGLLTPLKNRVIAGSQQIVRVDFEKVTPISEDKEKEVLDVVKAAIGDVDVVAISDYGKGLLTTRLLQDIIAVARNADVPVVVDPKGLDYARYRGATLTKPNFKEAYEAAGMSHDASLEDVAAKILRDTDAEYLLITRSKDGISLFDAKGKHQQFSVTARDVIDVTGAGDTVLSMLTCAIANGFSMEDAVKLSNVAASIAIERFGCARVTLKDIAERLLDDDIDNKIFEEEHIFALKNILSMKSFVTIGVEATKGLTSTIFQSIKRYARSHERELVIYIRDVDPDEEFVSILASLSEVGFIVIKSDSFMHLCNTIRPDEAFVIEDNKLVALESPEALLQ